MDEVGWLAVRAIAQDVVVGACICVFMVLGYKLVRVFFRGD